MQITATQLYDCLVDAAKCKVVPFIGGSPGIGKSSVVHRFIQDWKLFPLDVRASTIDQCDVTGFPMIDKETGKASYIPMDIFPLKGDPVPKGFNGWCLFFDELPNGDRGVQKAMYKVILDRLINTTELHEKVVIIAAGNLETDNAFVEAMPTPLQSRMIQLEMIPDADSWLAWAVTAGIDTRITSFIRWKNEMLYTFKPDHTDKTYACPRTWEFANRFMQLRNDLSDPILKANLAGCLSEPVSMQFLEFCRIQLPSKETVVNNPLAAPVPEDLAARWAMVGALANWIDQKCLVSILKYLDRLPTEYRAICAKDIGTRKPEVKAEQDFQDWMLRNASIMF